MPDAPKWEQQQYIYIYVLIRYSRDQTHHTGGLVEHIVPFMRKVAYSSYGVPYKMCYVHMHDACV
jgi:hypothetical protein